MSKHRQVCRRRWDLVELRINTGGWETHFLGCSQQRFGVSATSRLCAGQERDGALQKGALIRSSLDFVQTFLQADGGF